MSGVTDLTILLRSAKPEHNQGDYVFCNVPDLTGIDMSKVVMMFREKEATTLIMALDYAESINLQHGSTFSWITLTIHSSLEAVGLTAAFSTALAAANISCNVVAGYYHDHIFVGSKDLDQAMTILSNM